MSHLPANPIPLPPLPEQPLVSVLLPNYNYARFLPDAIASVQRQTYTRWELVVCDDGSTDNSCDIVDRYCHADFRITLIAQPNGGQAAALNAAYQASHGQILCILDADDLFVPHKLQSLVTRFTQRPNAGLLVHAMTLVDPEGVALHRIPHMGRFEEGWIANRVLRRGGRWRYMPSSAIAFRRELAQYGFPIPNERFAKGAEGLLFTLFPLLTEVTHINDALSIYRIHGSNMGGRLEFDADAARKGASLMSDVILGVNERLAEMGVAERLRTEDNLYISLDLFVASLLDGDPRSALVGRYLHTAAAILCDDLYTFRQKLMLPLFWGGALLVPKAWRQTWLHLTISSGALKHVKRLWSELRRPSRRLAAGI
jgi:glycosyltransferase involved in cell wall biosynthesis